MKYMNISVQLETEILSEDTGIDLPRTQRGNWDSKLNINVKGSSAIFKTRWSLKKWLRNITLVYHFQVGDISIVGEQGGFNYP